MKKNTRNKLATFSAWLQTELGQDLLQHEVEILQPLLSNFFGYHLLVLGSELSTNLIKESRINHKVLINSEEQWPKNISYLPADYAKIPIRENSIDLVVIPHTLEYLKNPHEVIREAYRVLIPEGHIVILNFNPYSPLWWSAKILKETNTAPYHSNFIRQNRIEDWLKLLGCDISFKQNFYFKPPINNSKIRNYFSSFEKYGKKYWSFLGAAYIIVAKKRISTLTPIKPRWRANRRVLVKEGNAV